MAWNNCLIAVWSYGNIVIWCSTLCCICTLGPSSYYSYTTLKTFHSPRAPERDKCLVPGIRQWIGSANSILAWRRNQAARSRCLKLYLRPKLRNTFDGRPLRCCWELCIDFKKKLENMAIANTLQLEATVTPVLFRFNIFIRHQW